MNKRICQGPDIFMNRQNNWKNSTFIFNCSLFLIFFPLFLSLSWITFVKDASAHNASNPSGANSSGTRTLGDLEIGDRVVDLTWEWKRVFYYTGNLSIIGDPSHITWIVVAKDHYGAGSGVTLLSERSIGDICFDNSTHLSNLGYNHWGESGTNPSATHGLRPFLNSTGVHAGEGFLKAFSPTFKNAILEISLPNKHGEPGVAYTTNDKVFVPSNTELGVTEQKYSIGEAYPYFFGATNEDRIMELVPFLNRPYWTRSPYSTTFDGRTWHVRVFSIRIKTP